MQSPTNWIEANDTSPTVQMPALPQPQDFAVAHHGSIVILHALTPAARAWVDEHLPADAMTWGVNGTVVEPRYIEDIVNGFLGDGLTVRS